jgi:hypothetical protein
MYTTPLLNLTSREFEISCRMQDLIGKLTRKVATRDEESELQLLQRERLYLMTPKPHWRR